MKLGMVFRVWGGMITSFFLPEEGMDLFESNPRREQYMKWVEKRDLCVGDVIVVLFHCLVFGPVFLFWLVWKIPLTRRKEENK